MRHVVNSSSGRLLAGVVLIIALMLCMFAPAAVFAQSPVTLNANVDVDWMLPTETACVNPSDQDPETCARLPLTGTNALTHVELYVSQSPIADDSALQPAARMAPNTTEHVFIQPIQAGATLYFRLKARNAHGLSKFSEQVSKVIEVPGVAPGVPTGVTVTVQIQVAQ